MRRLMLLCFVALVAHAAVASAQKPAAPAAPAAPAPAAGLKASDVAGTWDGKTMMGPKDSVVATWVMAVTADGKGWTLTLPNRAPIPARILASGGVSIVTEMGPYESVVRPGQMVTTRSTGHYKGDAATGTLEGHYASGDVLQGKWAAKRRK